jgi:hypothetical protein
MPVRFMLQSSYLNVSKEDDLLKSLEFGYACEQIE